MLKALRQTYPEEGIHFLRDQQVVEIRKSQRELQFKKRRTLIERQPSQHTTNPQQLSKPNRRKIVDPTLQNEINMILQEDVTVEMLPLLQSYLYSEDKIEVHKGLIGMRRLLCLSDPPIQAIIQLEIEERIIKLAKSEYPQLQLESAWCLANLTFQNNYQAFVQRGAIQCLFDLLECGIIQTVEQAIWGLGNLTYGYETRKRMLCQNGISRLIQVGNTFNDKNMVEQVCWGIASLIRGNPPSQYELAKQGILFLCCYVENGCIHDPDILTDCIIAISCHCECSSTVNKGKTILNSKIIPKTIPFLEGSNRRLATSVLRMVGNLATGGEQVGDQLLKADLLTYIQKCLDDRSVTVRQQSCWILSNLSAGAESHVRIMLSKEKLISRLLDMLTCDQIRVKKEIVFIFANMTSNCGDFQIQQFFVSNSIIGSMIDLLQLNDQNLSASLLKNLYLILKRAKQRGKLDLIMRELLNCSAISILESMQQQSNRIYREVTRIFIKFFECEEAQAL